MLRRSLKSVVTTWLTGLLALLPLALTLALLAWIFSLLNRLVGPSTLIGQLFAALGQQAVKWRCQPVADYAEQHPHAEQH